MDIPNIDLVYKKLHDRLNENLNSRLEETISETNDGIFAAKKRIFHLICDVLDDYEISIVSLISMI